MSTAARHARWVRFAIPIVVLGLVTACGGGSKGTSNSTSASTPGSSATSSSAGTSSAAASTTEQTSTSAAGNACTPSPAVLAAAKTFTEISKVSLIGGCGEVSAETTLPPGALGSPSVSRAITMCTAISKVAYVGSIYGVSVDGKDGHELASSTKGQPCV